jgi:hypothetical protein
MMQKPRQESNRSMYDCTGCPLNRKACATVVQEPVICNEESCNRPKVEHIACGMSLVLN